MVFAGVEVFSAVVALLFIHLIPVGRFRCAHNSYSSVGDFFVCRIVVLRRRVQRLGMLGLCIVCILILGMVCLVVLVSGLRLCFFLFLFVLVPFVCAAVLARWEIKKMLVSWRVDFRPVRGIYVLVFLIYL